MRETQNEIFIDYHDKKIWKFVTLLSYEGWGEFLFSILDGLFFLNQANISKNLIKQKMDISGVLLFFGEFYLF